MALRTTFGIIIFLLSAVCLCVECKTKITKNAKAIERPILVGAFNIQNLGNSKLSNNTVMNIIKKILLRYDLVLVQEIVTLDEDMVVSLLKSLNRLSPKGVKYMMQISERLGRGNAKEQYAYIYRNDKLIYLEGHTYPDPRDEFMRPPYIVHFSTPTLRDLESMVVIGIHTQPKNATNETSALAKVYDYAVKTFQVQDAIIMGDMNAGCQNVRISDWNIIDLWRRKEFTWLISHDFDTTLSVNCCPYDRIVIAGENMENAIIWDSVSVFKYKDVYDVSNDLALAVSDHWPVEVKLRGSSERCWRMEHLASTRGKQVDAPLPELIEEFEDLIEKHGLTGTLYETEKNLSPSLCLSVHDSRKTSLPLQLRKQKMAYGFSILISEDMADLFSESKNSTAVLQNLQNLGLKYKELISPEVIEAVIYKVNHGALDDRSSHADLQHSSYSAKVYFDALEETTTVYYCTATTIN